MPRAYKFITAVLALTGCGGLLITGETSPLMSLSGVALIPGYYRFLKGQRHASKNVVGMLSVFTLAVFVFDAVAVSRNILLAVAHLTIAFQAIKSFDLKEPWDNLQVFFMSLLQLIIASELSHSLVFGVVFIFFLTMLVTAMVLSHFLKEGALGKVSLFKPVFVITVLTVLATIVLFMALPRESYRFLGKGQARTIRTVGFSDKVDFGSFGAVKLDPTVVMRIELDRDLHSPYYWRGLSLAYFDGWSWRHSLGSRHPVRRIGDEYAFSSYDRKAAVEQKIYLEPIDSDVIFGLAEIRSIKTDSSALLSDTARDIFLRGKPVGGVKYTVYSIIEESYPGIREEKYLQLPVGTQRIVDLAKSITVGAKTDEERARAIERYLRNNYTYSLSTSSAPEGITPLENFLFRSKRGFCEHYATSMVIMLRGSGIPSRIVNGFYGGELNRYGGYIIVRQSDAHSWVEALIGNMWRRYDPTPPLFIRYPSAFTLFLDAVTMNWSRYVVGFSTTDQKRIVRTLSLPFGMPVLEALRFSGVQTLWYIIFPVAIFAFLALYYGYDAWELRKKGFVTRYYLLFRKTLKKMGFTVLPSTTSGELRRGAASLKSHDDVEKFVTMYEEHRFARKEMGPEERRKYRSLLTEIRKQGRT
jgi:transglutaminase-like putative cysteine protease